MGNFEFSGSFPNLPDPDYEPGAVPVVGFFIGGKPVRQGWESGQLKWGPLLSAAFAELRTRYEEQKNDYTVGKLVAISGYGYQNVTAWWHEPLPTGWDGNQAHGVTQTVTRVVRG